MFLAGVAGERREDEISKTEERRVKGNSVSWRGEKWETGERQGGRVREDRLGSRGREGGRKEGRKGGRGNVAKWRGERRGCGEEV